MKKFAVLFLLALVPSLGVAATKVVPGQVYDITPQWWPEGVTMVADTGTTTSINEVDLTQADRFWIGALLTINDISSTLTDSTRLITGFNATLDSLSFAAFGTAVAKGDSFYLSLPDHDPYSAPPTSWVLRDSVVIDTSQVYLMEAGASITSEHLFEHDDAKDSVNTLIVLQIALSPTMSNNQTSWIRTDSITYSSQDTVVYKAWGAKQATMFRFILDPVNASFRAATNSNKVKHYGKVIVDK